jgi:hypothetical protein
LADDISSALRLNGYNTISVETAVTPSGVYIHMTDGSYKWHISFHLEKQNKPPPGALHIKNNITKHYQMLYVKHYPSVCNPSWTNHIELVRSSYLYSKDTSICGIYENTFDIALSVVNQYLMQSNNPLSLYNNLSGRYNRHYHLMAIIRSRPTEIRRTRLTQGVKGRKSKQTRKKKTNGV